MDKSKSTRKNYGTAYFATAFLAAFFFEFYWIMTDPTNYFMLLGTGFIMIVMGYLTIDSLLKTKADNEALRAEQNEMMLKAQKAIYIATKKNSKDSAKRQAQNIKAMEIMMNKMIASQQALLEEKNTNGDDISSLIDQLSESNAKLAKEVQSAITVNQLVKANADLVKNVKEALSANAMSLEQTVDLGVYVNEAVGNHEQPKKIAPVSIEKTPVMDSPINETPDTKTSATETFATETPATEAPLAETLSEVEPDAPAINEEPDFTPELDIPNMNVEDLLSPEFDMPDVNVGEVFIPDLEEPAMTVEETSLSSEAAENIESITDVDIDISADIDIPMDIDTPEDIVGGEPMDDDTMNAIENEINMDEMERSEALEELIIPDEMTAELDEAMTEGNPEEIMADITDSMEDIEDIEDIKDIEDVENIGNIENIEAIETMNTAKTAGDTGIAENEAEDIVEPIDVSSGEIPNRQLSDEEIAALFASL